MQTRLGFGCGKSLSQVWQRDGAPHGQERSQPRWEVFGLSQLSALSWGSGFQGAANGAIGPAPGLGTFRPECARNPVGFVVCFSSVTVANLILSQFSREKVERGNFRHFIRLGLPYNAVPPPTSTKP